MVCTSALALAVPVTRAAPDAPGIRSEPGSNVSSGGWATAQAPWHFSAGDTLAVDARLGHASLARRAGVSRAAGETFVFASVTGADTAASSAPPTNLAIVIDRSGSMVGQRIANAIAGAVGAVERMREQDIVTVVSFDTAAKVVVPPTRATADARDGILAAIRNIRLGGDTCISCGLEEAMRQLESSSSASDATGDRVNRIVLLSDGEPTDGVKDVPGFRALAAGMRDRGFPITTIGVDVHYEEKVMEAIAVESNGHHYFVANPSGLPAIFAEEFDTLASAVATNAELSIDLAPGVEVEEVFDRTYRREGKRVVVPFGAFAAKQEKTVLMRVRVPVDSDGSEPVAKLSLSFHDLVSRGAGECDGALAVDVVSDGSEQHALDPFVAARVERSKTAATLLEANDLFKQGRIAEARATLAAQQKDLDKSEARALATATAAPAKAKGRGIPGDFAEQKADIERAQAGFAASALPASPAPQNTPQGQAAVRQNATGNFRESF
jgi:Ca-activated chloride channel family protein